MIVRVLTEVKVREDEYDLIKRYLSRIQGLPSSAQLATRERRLLQQGILHLVNLTDSTADYPARITGISKIPSPTTKQNGANSVNRTSRLATAVNQWDVRRGRSESTSSSSTGMSFNSGTASSRASSRGPTTPRSTSFSPFQIPIVDGLLNRTETSASGELQAFPDSVPRRSIPSSETPVQVFIFTDLVLLASPSAVEAGKLTLLERTGIVRILGIQDPELPGKESNGLLVSAS